MVLAAALVAGALTFGVQPANAATTVDIEDCGNGALGRPPACGPFIFIHGDPGSNEIALAFNLGPTLVDIRDERAHVIAPPSCEVVGSHRVRCPYFHHDLAVFSGRGDDRIDMGNAPDLGAGPEVSGGQGQDVVIGSRHPDILYGGMGRDVVRGMAGDDFLTGASGNFGLTQEPADDVLFGGAGADKLGERADRGNDVSVGGPGNDRINGSDGRPDAGMLGGHGRDQCRIDEQIDPEPSGCENVFSHRWVVG